MNRPPVGIYIHIPFCATKCPYCDFYSVKYSKALEKDYVDALIKSFSLYKKDLLTIDTIYLGGGTPSLITTNSIDRILTAINSTFNLLDGAEITIEANPKTVNYEKLLCYYKAGINRISFGMQSVVDSQLKLLGRNHNEAVLVQNIKDAKDIGITNISLDLMLNTPNQTFLDVYKSLEFIKSQDVRHLSVYMLKIEENTPYDIDDMINACPSEDDAVEIYLKTVDYLKTIGFNHYEISNFSKAEDLSNNNESKHNLKYWNLDDYIGFGVSAHSCYNKKRYYYNRNIDEFIKSNGTNIIIDEDIDEDTLYAEYIMLKLRLSTGIDLTELKEKFGILDDTIKKLLDKSKSLEKYNLMIIDGNNIKLTTKGFLVSNEIITTLLTI